MWTMEESARLKEVTIDSARHTREKLLALKDHFEKGGSLFSVVSNNEPVHVSAPFGRKFKRLLADGQLDWLGNSNPEPGRKPANAVPVELDTTYLLRHYDNLVAPLLDLREVEPFPIHSRDIATWYIRPDLDYWTIAKGKALRDVGGSITVKLFSEENTETEFRYLRQHLPQDRIWDIIEVWKQAISNDFTARFRLLRRVVNTIEVPEEDGGLGMPVVEWPEREERPGPVAGMYLAFIVYDQILTSAMNLNHTFYERGSVRFPSPNLLELEGYGIVRSDDKSIGERAVEFLFEGWKQKDWNPELRFFIESYYAGEQATQELMGQVSRLRSPPPFPEAAHVIYAGICLDTNARRTI